MTATNPGTEFHTTACILCSINCGIQVQLDGRHLTRIRGDKNHPASKGYTCEKPARLDHYQNSRDRLQSPMRRRPDGSYEEIDWDTAIREVAERLAEVRDTHGGEKIFFYGGGGQGNHLGGIYASATVKALGSRYRSNALAQEKTGEFWVDGQLYGNTSCHTAPDFEHAQVSVFVGKNPWQSHGFPRARIVLKEIARDPARKLIVIDPRRTETADLADIHLQVRPGTDAFCLSAILKVLEEESLMDREFMRAHTTHTEGLEAALALIDVADYCARAGVEEAKLREAARTIGRAESVSVLEDLGVQQAPHSTLNSYLEKLIYLVTGNFGKPGGMNLHTAMGKLIGSTKEDHRSPVKGHKIISGLIPCNAVPDEILTDHADRFRAMVVESANPAHSIADSQRMRQALEALDFVVVVDVAMTETARCADYVLPAASQYEKWECTFFTLEFPHNVFHVRKPLLEPLPGTLPEAEIHSRLVRALGALPEDAVTQLRGAADRGRTEFAIAFAQLVSNRPELQAVLPVLLYETLGKTLEDGAQATAALWGAAQMCANAYPEAVRRAGFSGEGPALGDALFDAMLERRSGFVFSVDDYAATWTRLETEDGSIRLTVPDLMEEWAGIADEQPALRDDAFPFVLAAGERRTSSANTIYRDPAWRRKDALGALRMNPEDAARLGIASGGRVRVTTKRASAEAVVEVTDTLQPGHASLPNGLGLDYPDADGVRTVHGVAPNELTASEDCDWIAGTPWHKHVRARIEALGGAS